MGSIIPPIEIYLDMLLAELIAQSATKILSNLAGLSLRPDPNDRSKSEVVWFVTNWHPDRPPRKPWEESFPVAFHISSPGPHPRFRSRAPFPCLPPRGSACRWDSARRNTFSP